jgi:MgtE intracellular N domain
MKKILAIILPILILGGAFVGLALMGVLKIPGLTPVKPKQGKGAIAGKAAPTPAPPLTDGSNLNKDKPTDDSSAKKPSLSKVASAPIKNDPDQGAAQLAVIWNQMDTTKFKDLLKDWKDPDVARVFLKMKPDIVAGILAAMDPKRASIISKLMEKQSSIVVEDQTS